MRDLIGRLLLIIILISGLQAQANTIPARLDSLILAGKDHIYHLQMYQAEADFIQAQRWFPEFPHGYVYQAFTTGLVFTMDQTNETLGNKLDLQLDRAETISDAFIAENKDHPGGYFHLALTQSIRAMTHIVDRNYLRAYWSGNKSMGALERVVELDSTYYDAYMGLGLFHYYAGLLPGFLKFIAGILGFEGNKELGKTELQKVVDNGHFFRVESEFILYSIAYFLEGDKWEALRDFQKLYHRYPDNQAVGLIIAYHYRRSGYSKKCLLYCEGFGDAYADLLPQLSNVRRYNMGIAYYNLNDFSKADSMFHLLETLPTRKSPYYRAAIAYYRGLMADLRGERELARERYARIADEKQTRYWYLLAEMPRRYPMDSLMVEFTLAKNLLNSRHYAESLQRTLQLQARIAAGETSVNPDVAFLVTDLLGRNYYYTRRYREARSVYEGLLENLNDMKSEYYRAWIYIHYQRTLRELQEFDLARKFLKKADTFSEEYMHLLVQREEHILNRREQSVKNQTG